MAVCGANIIVVEILSCSSFVYFHVIMFLYFSLFLVVSAWQIFLVSCTQMQESTSAERAKEKY